MKSLPAFVLATLLPLASIAQMMGGQLSTAIYFPMVDGARYEYRHTGGPWSTSAVTVRMGQTWAGYPDLAAMHTTYVCNVGVACAPDATDFFRMDGDGLRYFGGTGSDFTGSLYSMMSLANPEWLLKNPVVPGTMMGGPGGGYANAEGWGAAVYGTGSMMGTRSYMSAYRAMALETVTTPAGTFENSLHVREDRGSGYGRDVWYAPGVGIVMMNDGTQTAMLTGYAIPGSPPPGASAATMPFMPFNGLWWNPDESGTGYNIQVQHGVMVATMFSYTPAGDPVWYYTAGPLSRAGNGLTVGATLDRYHGGQCISCTYKPATVAGSDGGFTIMFSSPTAATVSFPGGRTTNIQPQPW